MKNTVEKCSRIKIIKNWRRGTHCIEFNFGIIKSGIDKMGTLDPQLYCVCLSVIFKSTEYICIFVSAKCIIAVISRL